MNGGQGLVQIETGDRIVTATFNSPPANALSLDLAAGLQEVCDAVEDSGARVLVLRSAVPGFFVAGADLKLIGTATSEEFADYLERLRAAIQRVAELDAVSIAAIGGHALGAGLELSCACTLRVAGEDATLGVPEVKLGLLPGAGGTQRLPRLIGAGPALDLLLTGRSIDGAEAH
ncbi:MAG: enoyl-CoA hydratase/isomerase family protein, partial [Solirubrobacterales bacterium]